MSKFFLRKFKSLHKCPKCSDDKISGFSLCPKHLTRARYEWRARARAARAEGKCGQCPLKAIPNQLRCKLHAELNRKKCRAWLKEHPEHNAEAYAERVAYREAGFCPQCPQHRKLREDEGRCWVCRERNRLRDKIGTAGMKVVIRERYGTRFDRKLISA